jgi:ketosteroid isomerase-like protein
VSRSESVEVVLACFAAVEQRDEERQRALFHPDVEFHWPPSLPYQLGFERVWDPLQPTADERRMSPRVVAASESEVVVLWQQRGRNAAGRTFQCPVLGLYEVRDHRLARAQMFYFDTGATAAFLASPAETGTVS